MNAIVTVCGKRMGRLEYRNQPIITLPMIDELHERPPKTSTNAFNRNKEMFIEGTDYFEVPFAEWRPILKSRQIGLRNAEKPILKSYQTRNQDEELNLEFPFPVPPAQPAALSAAEIPSAAAETAIRLPKHRQQKLPLPEVKKNGGRRGCMYFLTESGYVMLTTLFNDPRSKEIKRVLVRSYFGQGTRRGRA